MRIINFESIDLINATRVDEVISLGFCGDFGIPRESITNYRRYLINSVVSQKNKTVGYAALKNDCCLGLILINLSEWDSEIFGFPFGKILWFNVLPESNQEVGTQLLNVAMNKAKELGVECLTSRINYDQIGLIHILEDNGFRLMDVSITLGVTSDNISEAYTESEDQIIRPATLNDLSSLKEIAGSSFRYSHFHMDPRLSEDKTGNLFACWIENAVKGKASKVLILEVNNEISGFVTLNIDSLSQQTMGFGLGELDLLVVNPKNQGKGFGSRLVLSGLQWLKPRVKYVEVRTQLANKPAIRALMRNQFQSLNNGVALLSGATFHRWL